jgi:hypothetical protein
VCRRRVLDFGVHTRVIEVVKLSCKS